MPDGLFNRRADNWRPLLAIAALAGGEWVERSRAAALAVTHDTGADPKDSVRAQALADIRAIITDKDHVFLTPNDGPAIFSADLAAAMNAMEGRPWADFSQGKPLTTNALARLLNKFGIVPRDLRDAQKVKKGYLARAFDDAFSRYLQSDTLSQPLHRYMPRDSRDSGRNATATRDEPVAVANPLNPATRAGCSGVAVEKPPAGENERAEHENDGFSADWVAKLDRYHQRLDQQLADAAAQGTAKLKPIWHAFDDAARNTLHPRYLSVHYPTAQEVDASNGYERQPGEDEPDDMAGA
jgi:hypothetical protein